MLLTGYLRDGDTIQIQCADDVSPYGHHSGCIDPDADYEGHGQKRILHPLQIVFLIPVRN